MPIEHDVQIVAYQYLQALCIGVVPILFIMFFVHLSMHLVERM